MQEATATEKEDKVERDPLRINPIVSGVHSSRSARELNRL